MATINAGSTAGNQATSVEKGVNVVECRVSLSATASAGDVFRIGKLPHGAIPLDAIFYSDLAVDLSTGPALRFGTSASAEMFFASTSYSLAMTGLNGDVIRCTRRLASFQQVSLSDDAMPRYEHIVMTHIAAGGAGIGSIGHYGTLVVYYKMPNKTL